MPKEKHAKLKLLHLEDNPNDAELILGALHAEGVDCEVHRVVSREEFEAALSGERFDVIISDHALPAFDGMSALRIANVMAPDTPFIFVSGTIGEERAVESLKSGAVDYVLKDRTNRLVSAVKRAHQDSLDRQRRKQVEAELQHRNALFRQITESVDDLIAVLDADGRAVFTSPSYIALSGQSNAPNRFFKNVVLTDFTSVTGMFRQVSSDGIAKRLGYKVRDLVGRVRHLESQWTVIRDLEGKVTNVVVVSRDVSEREQAAATIREQAELLNNARDAIFVRDLDERVAYWNRGAERVYGWKANEVIGRRVSEFLYKADAPRREDIWKIVVEKGEWQGELAQITKDGSEICVMSRRTLLRNLKGEITAVLNINTDITEKKALEMQVLRSQRVESIGSLAGGIAHDLNNVLAPILMATELARDHVANEETRRMLDIARASATRGADLVKQILQFARGNKGEQAVINISTVIKELARFAKNTFPPSIAIETQLEEKNVNVTGDATQLHQVFLNLFVNARDAMPQGGRLSVAARTVELAGHVFARSPKPVNGRFIEVSVQDTGTGIPDSIVPRIFEPFFSTKAPERGTGLGLSTAATIVQNHNGVIDLSTSPMKGTTFRVYLPLAPATTDTTRAEADAPLPTGNGEWILLVDDELALLQMTKELLEAYGYHVITASNGSQALIEFGTNKNKIRAVVTDLLMPGLGGQQLIAAMRDIGTNAVFICVSGSADENSMTAEGSGAHVFLRKPCPTATLLKTVSKLLETHA